MIKFGFHEGLWAGKYNNSFNLALDEIALTGWDGLEFASKYLEIYLDNHWELKKLLTLHDLEMASFYTPLVLTNKNMNCDIDTVKKKINLIKEMGSEILLLDDAGDKNIKINKEILKTALEKVKKICDLSLEQGLKPTWHQHWGSLFSSLETFEYLMESTENCGLFFCPDTAQLYMSGMDPFKIIKKYRSRISYIHFKDLKMNDPINNCLNIKDSEKYMNVYHEKYEYLNDKYFDNGCYHINSKYKITEVLRGIIDFKPIANFIKESDYCGWIVVDQDYTEYKVIESADVNLKNLKFLFS